MCNIIAIIPARSGSQSIVDKNINLLADHPLIAYSIAAAKLSKKIDRIIIENQIGPLALRMKMMQGMITQHFIENNLEKIELVNASNKLKDFL